MKYKTLGRSGLGVSTIALGTMNLGSQTPEKESFAILDSFLEAGGNLVDTSNVYVGGKVEELLGRWFAARPRDLTDRVVLATKGRFAVDPDLNAPGLSRRGLTRALEGSLRRLGRESVDLYQLHAWDPLTPVEETLSFIDTAVRSGKMHYFGVSNFTGWQLQLLVSTARAMGVVLPVTLQQQYSLLSRESEWEVVPAALHNGISLLPWSPLAGGFLTGKYARGGQPASDTRAGSDNQLYRWVSAEYADSDRNWATIDTVVRIAREVGATPGQVALAWAANKPTVISPIIGARDVKQLKENLASVDVTLDAAAMKALDEVSTPACGGYPYGAFGVAQRSRSVEGGNATTELTRDGSPAPLGHA